MRISALVVSYTNTCCLAAKLLNGFHGFRAIKIRSSVPPQSMQLFKYTRLVFTAPFIWY